MRTARRAVLAAVVLAGAATACGSSHTATSVAAVPTTVAGSPSGPLLYRCPVPAVTGATDLTRQPTIAAGTGSPPTRLTGADLVVGSGSVASASSTVKVRYVGALYANGQVFDASWTDPGGPSASFSLTQVIPGFRDAITGMKVGSRREVVIPPAEGYGAAGSPPAIPGNATLVFVIDLLGVS